MPENYHKYIDAFSIYGDSLEEFRYTDEDPFGCDQPDYIDALKEYVATLSPRHMDVYTAMDQRASGGADRITFTDVAKKYEVSCNQIKKDREKIERMIIKRVGPKYQNDDAQF